MPNTSNVSVRQTALDRIMPRHAPFYFGLAAAALALATCIWVLPKFAVTIAAIALFVVYLALAFIKLPQLTADYLREHAQDEYTPSGGIFFVVLVVVVASVVSLFLALNSSKPDPAEVVISVASVILGWFTVQAVGAFHYAYEYYQAPKSSDGEGVEGGLDFPGNDEPDGTAFMYFSYSVGTSVAASDTKIASNAMRRRLVYHIVFSHLYNTIILASAVNVMLAMGGGGGG
jgi:uncharacterized membrane protein